MAPVRHRRTVLSVIVSVYRARFRFSGFGRMVSCFGGVVGVYGRVGCSGFGSRRCSNFQGRLGRLVSRGGLRSWLLGDGLWVTGMPVYWG